MRIGNLEVVRMAINIIRILNLISHHIYKLIKIKITYRYYKFIIISVKFVQISYVSLRLKILNIININIFLHPKTFEINKKHVNIVIQILSNSYRSVEYF